jgi:hypothetical protein
MLISVDAEQKKNMRQYEKNNRDLMLLSLAFGLFGVYRTECAGVTPNTNNGTTAGIITAAATPITYRYGAITTNNTKYTASTATVKRQV